MTISPLGRIVKEGGEPMIYLTQAIEEAQGAIKSIQAEPNNFNPAVRPHLSVDQRAGLLMLAFQNIGVPRQTALRVARWLDGYSDTPDIGLVRHVMGPIFEDPSSTLVTVKKIRFTALCMHHLLPFSGLAAVAYYPQGKVFGLSKAARVVNFFAKRATLQEHITASVADALDELVSPEGVAVALYDVQHCCMSMRGVEDHEAETDTFEFRGIFNEPSRQDFFINSLRR